MRCFARQDGSLIAVNPDTDPGAPATSLLPLITETPTATFDFDSSTNAALVTDVMQDFHITRAGRYKVVGGALQKDGVAVTIAAPSQFVSDQLQSMQAATQIDNFLQSLDGGQTLTAAQIQTAIKILLRIARFVLRWIARH